MPIATAALIGPYNS